MPGVDQRRGRVVALVALLLLVGVALRGYLPGDGQAPRQQPAASPLSLFADVALLGASLVIVALAIVAWLRDPRKSTPATHDLPRSPGGNRERPRWRLLLICVGAFLVWLLILMLLMRLAGPPHRIDQNPGPTRGAPASPGNGSPPRPETGRDVFWYLAGTTAVMLVLLVVAAVVAIRRRGHPAPRPVIGDHAVPHPAAAGPESLALAAERGLAEIEDLSREPREAIIACYAAMERALADAPGAMPQDSDTPSEVLARAVEHHAIHAGSATELVNLFTEARFSVHVMNEAHREAAVAALQLVLAEVRSLA
ncbi:MAG: DUF4129 domain-containing protein [Mycobacteriaceae bacterium]|nr:DUF4129 domain-containing protein [Mycobacteriaceae bacterium]